ncbi:MAG TPA: hypothetical protein DCX12_01565 [Chloroflexi bacterium]|nr:hypothetical protein [Chloroflexota bacterium]
MYVGGPFRGPTEYDMEINVRRAVDLGVLIAEMGAVPVIWHSMYRHMQGTFPGHFLDEASLQILSTCHAMAVTVGLERARRSEGTVKDMQLCYELRIPEFYDEGPVADAEVECLATGRTSSLLTVRDPGPGGLREWIRHWKSSSYGKTPAFNHMVSGGMLG